MKHGGVSLVSSPAPRQGGAPACPGGDKALAPTIAASSSRIPMHIALLGTSNKTSQLDLREQLAFSPHELGPALEAMTAVVDEGTILSTCHRVELYAAVPSLTGVRATLTRFWSTHRGVPRKGLGAHLYYLEDEEAIAHLFSVAGGMDSAIVGEPQILGQVRGALEQSLEHHATGSVLSGLVRQAVSVGKRIRTETGISRNAASISYAAVELARDMFGDLRSSRVLLVGTGKMGELAARNLLSKGVAGLAVAGRTPARTRQLALECGSAVATAELEDALPRSDIVISCTSAPHHVITKDLVERAMEGRGGRPLILIDIAVPRDIEPAAGEVAGVRLFNIDDLEATVAANLRERSAEAPKVAAIIDEEIAVFQAWRIARRAVPTIVALQQHAESIRQAELARTSAVLARLPQSDRRRIEALTLSFQKKLLHQSIALLRAEAVKGNSHGTDRAVRQLFALDAK